MGSKTKRRTLEDLKKIKIKTQNQASVERQKASLEPTQKVVEAKKGSSDAAHDDTASFFNAMQGVTKLNGTSHGREVPAKTEVKTVHTLQQKNTQKSVATINFEWEYSAEYMQGYVAGLDSKIFQQLKAGAFPVQAHLDLHGMTIEQAQDTLLFFARECYLQSKRCFLVVTGKGKNSPGGQAVLRQELQEWLTKEPLRQTVLAFCSAQPRDGGAGAVYVLLRKHDKKRGKIYTK